MAGQDILYNYEAEIKYIKLKHIVFDDNTIEEAEEEIEEPES